MLVSKSVDKLDVFNLIVYSCLYAH